MGLDTKLVAAIRDQNYDVWNTDDLNSNRFTSDQNFRHIKRGTWNRLVAWDLGKLRDPNAMVVFKWCTIETAWENSQRHINTFRTAIYQVVGIHESHNDYTIEVQRLQRMVNDGKWSRPILVFDATGVGVAVEEQVRHLQGFERIVPLQITSGTKMETGGKFAIAGKSRLLSELEQVVKQRRIRIPDRQQTDRLARQLTSFRVEETNRGYRAVDDRREGHHFDLLVALAMGVSFIEYKIDATFSRII